MAFIDGVIGRGATCPQHRLCTRRLVNAIFQQRFRNMDANNFTENQPGIDSRAIRAGKLNALRQPTLKVNRAFSHARCFDQQARRGGQPCAGKFILTVR